MKTVSNKGSAETAMRSDQKKLLCRDQGEDRVELRGTTRHVVEAATGISNKKKKTYSFSGVISGCNARAYVLIIIVKNKRVITKNIYTYTVKI